MPGAFIPPEHEKGDANTIGGYAAVHGRPAAFEGADGLSYTVEIAADSTGDSSRPYGAFFLFLRWNRTAEPVVTGHLETGFLEYGDSAAAARDALGKMTLARVKSILDAIIGRGGAQTRTRPWWEAMREEDDS
jgi:hypothetical protein